MDINRFLIERQRAIRKATGSYSVQTQTDRLDDGRREFTINYRAADLYGMWLIGEVWNEQPSGELKRIGESVVEG